MLTDAAGNTLADTDGTADGFLVLDRSTGSPTQDLFRLDGDTNGDAVIDVADLLAVLAAWGPCLACDADTNGDGQVDVADLLAVLAAWGTSV